MLKRLGIFLLMVLILLAVGSHPVHAADPVIATALGDVTVWGGPGTQYENLGTLTAGNGVVLDGRSGRWYRFSFPNSDTKGWLPAGAVAISGDVNNLPDVSYAPGQGPDSTSVGFVPVGTTGVAAIAFGNVIIRGGPGTQFDQLGILPAGQGVILDGRTAGWYRFSFLNTDVKGWVSAKVVKIVGDRTSLPDVTNP